MVSLIKYGIGSLEDLPRIVELKIAMFEESKHKQHLHPKSASIILKDYQRLYATNKARHFVALLENNIVAMAGAFLKSDLPFRSIFVVTLMAILGMFIQNLLFGTRVLQLVLAPMPWCGLNRRKLKWFAFLLQMRVILSIKN